MTKKNLRFSVLSFFYIALILHGLQRTSGLFIIEFSKIKNITYQDAAIPFIYSWAVAKIVASFSDFLIDDKSSELVVFCGVLLSSMGAALCILDTDITTITVFWGFLFGSGYGLASPHLTRDLSNMDTNKFFKEVPSSFGIFIMPFLLILLIVQFGIQGSFIMFSGIILQYVPFALAAAYNIEITIPNVKWRVRKKISQYSVSKQDLKKSISIESFNSSLEPDFTLKINQSCDYYSKINIESLGTSSKEKFRVGRKRSETRGNILKGLEIDRKKLQIYTTHYPTISEKKSSDNFGKISEENFSNTHVVDVQSECKGLKNLNILNSEVTCNFCKPNKNSFNNSKHDCDLKNKILENISQLEMKETECNKEESNYICLENNTLNEQTILDHTSTGITSLTTDEENDYNKHQIRENPETERRISFISKQAENTSLISNQFHSEKIFDKKTTVLSHQTIENTSVFTIPLNIKAHVEEYMITIDKECLNNSFDSNYSIDKINEELNYSKARFQEKDYMNYGSQTSKNTQGNFVDKSRLSDICSISNKFNNKRNWQKNSKAIDFNSSKDKLKLKILRILKFFNKIISPVCLCILVITIIFETSLITLLTNTGDFVNNSDQSSYDFKWILAAFGFGGFFGKLYCFKISKTVSENSHAVGIILFLLTGLSIAGVLYSPNLNWLAGFYSVLGALEGGISYILPKFILDYTHKEVHHTISSMKSFLSGIAIICLPSIRGLLPEEMGDYEFLLQTLSCLSVLCALIAYFLPYLRSISDKRISLSFKERLDMT